jgi:hypothetical protein
MTLQVYGPRAQEFVDLLAQFTGLRLVRTGEAVTVSRDTLLNHRGPGLHHPLGRAGCESGSRQHSRRQVWIARTMSCSLLRLGSD